MDNFNMPKILSVEIRKVDFMYRVFIHGVMFHREFVTYSQAKEHLAQLYNLQKSVLLWSIKLSFVYLTILYVIW
jgi:hypothetical protein